MTFDQIKRMAAQQLDEDPADMAEIADLLSAYVNEGYQIALRDYVRPRERFTCQTDKMGHAPMGARRILRVVELMDGEGRDGVHALTARTPGGRLVHLDGEVSAIGSFRRARITDSSTWALFGALTD